MLRFEIKKVFSKQKNKITVLALLALLIITSILTINRVEYVDENGNHSTGIEAARKLRAAKFAASIAMLVSALTRSTPAAVIMPFLILCVFPFLSRIITLPEICSFFPDQLLEIYVDLKESGLVEIRGKVLTIPMVILPVYAMLCILLQPILYRIYKKTDIK